MSIPKTCLTCAKKSCEQLDEEQLDICEYGVAFFYKDGNILRKEALVPLRYISHNLRHELNRSLNVLVEEAMKIDKNITSRKIDLNNPASKILGTTIIIDHFIQMIAGVNEFHPTNFHGAQLLKIRTLTEIIGKYFVIHSIIKNPRRSENLKLNLEIEKDMTISFCADIFEYLLSIFFDNIWKYSVSNTEVKVVSIKKNGGLLDIIFRNISGYIPDNIEIFSKGMKCDSESEGFGYGLFWANILIDHYNRLSLREENILKIVHNQTNIDKNLWIQDFSLINLIAEIQ